MRKQLVACGLGLGPSPASIDRSLRQLVRHAAASIPQYRRRFAQAGVDVSRIRSVDDLASLPITWRNEMAALPIEDCTDPSVNLKRCFHHATSGSSGSPIHVYMTRAEHAHRRLILGRALWRSTRMLPPVRIAEVGRVPKPSARPMTGLRGVFTVFKPPGWLPPAEQVAGLVSYRPTIVEGFPTALEEIARFCLDVHVELPRPRLVVSRGEVLTEEGRRILESAFRAPVVDYYNCEEVGNIAWQCPCDSARMHLNSDACIVEIVDDDGQLLPVGETGLIAVTNLYNYTMPFIRYVLGDRGRLLRPTSGRCACGVRAPSMALVEGRADDWIVLADGRRISPRVALTLLFQRPDGERVAGIRRYQVLQELPGEIVLKLVLDPDAEPGLFETLRATGRDRLGGLQLVIREVDAIASERSGKYKRVISLL